MAYDPVAAQKARDAAARARLTSLNEGPGDRAERAVHTAVNTAYAPIVAQGGQGPTLQTYRDVRAGLVNSIAQQQVARAAPKPVVAAKKKTTTTSSGGRSYGGGGGGGGGAAVNPMMSQSMIDWLANVLKSGKPGGQQFNSVDLPDAPSFNSQAYDQAMSAWGQAGQQDQGQINQSRSNMLSFLQNNYRNAYADPTVGSGGTPLGMDPATLQRLMQMQGVQTQGNSALQEIGGEAARAQGMAGDWRQAMSANEAQAQQNRIVGANQSADYSTNALNAALRGGNLQIGQARSQAEAAAQQQAWQAAVAEMQFNAQRQDQINAANATSSDSYRNAVMQQLMALAQANVGNTAVTLPDMAALGLA